MTRNGREIRPLTGIRGVAACWVVLYHCRLRGEAHATAPLRVLIDHGYLAVDLFFLLSGFVLALNYNQDFLGQWSARAYFSFLKKRIARIYPLFFVAVLGFFFLARAGYLYHLHAFYGNLPVNLLLMASWHTRFGTLDGPAWSISCEWLAYLLFPALCACILGGTRPMAIASVAIFCATLTALAFLPAWRFGESGFRSGPLDIWVGSTFGPIFRCLAEFGIGIALFRIGLNPLWRRMISARACVLGVAIATVVMLSIPRTDLIVVALFAVLILGLSAAEGVVATGLGSRPIYFLGVISYSIYLLHEPVLAAYRELCVRQDFVPGHVESLAIVLVVTLVLATVSYFAVERPGRRFVANLSIRGMLSWVPASLPPPPPSPVVSAVPASALTRPGAAASVPAANSTSRLSQSSSEIRRHRTTGEAG